MSSNTSAIAYSMVIQEFVDDLHFRLFSGFDKDPTTSKYEIYASVKQFTLIAQYKVKGSVIILPVVGSGPANLTFGL